MRILFDMRPVQKALFRGIGYYCMGLIKGLAANKDVQLGYLLDSGRAALPSGLPSGPRYFSDRLEYLDERYDVFLIGNVFSTLYYRDAYEYLVPVRVRERVDLVTAVAHDMIPWFERDQQFPWPIMRKKFLDSVEAMKRFDHIFCNSAATRNDIIEHAGVERSLCSVIYGSSNPGTSWRAQSYDFEKRANAVVYVGGNDTRKNVPLAIKGFAKAYVSGRIPADSKFFLVYKADDLSALRKAACDAGVGDRIVATGFLPDALLDELISRCKATVFPSLYEGLGMPIIESYRLDTPCFVGDNSSLRELSPPECRFDVSSAEGVADLFAAAFSDKKLCEKSITYGREIARELTWERVGQKAYDTLSGLLRTKASIARSDRVFVHEAAKGGDGDARRALAAAISEAPGRFAYIGDDTAAMRDLGVARYAPEFLARGATRISPAAGLYALYDDDASLGILREAARVASRENPRTSSNFLFLGAASYPRLLFSMAGKDIGKMQAMLFSSYSGNIDGLDSILSFEDLRDSGIACVAPIVAFAGIRTLVAADTTILAAVKKDIARSASPEIAAGASVLGIEGRGLNETILQAVGHES